MQASFPSGADKPLACNSCHITEVGAEFPQRGQCNCHGQFFLFHSCYPEPKQGLHRFFWAHHWWFAMTMPNLCPDSPSSLPPQADWLSIHQCWSRHLLWRPSLSPSLTGEAPSRSLPEVKLEVLLCFILQYKHFGCFSPSLMHFISSLMLFLLYPFLHLCLV